jgi:hypothetical protein
LKLEKDSITKKKNSKEKIATKKRRSKFLKILERGCIILD